MTVVAVMLLGSVAASAQKEFNVWCFGDSTGLDFNTTSLVPVPVAGVGLYMGEGSASVADRFTGELLFYSNGETVMNRNHRIMRNGTGLKGGYSSGQGALILPMPGDPSKYYLFGVAHEGHITLPDRGAFYSIVDMAADGGQGGVTVKNVPLVGPTTEKMVGVPHCNGKDFWVIVHTIGDRRFHAFAVTDRGVNPVPVVSTAGEVHANPRNWLAASPNGRLLASSVARGTMELFDFDPCSGVVSNARVLLPGNAGYGLCFSADNTKLYTLYEHDVWELVQFDLADTNRRYVIDTIVPAGLPNRGYVGAMQLGPDGRIYCAKLSYEWLGVIDQPNLTGPDCGYRDDGVYLNGRRGVLGLPNVVTGLYRPPVPSLEISDTLFCGSGCVTPVGSVIGNVMRHRWTSAGGSPVRQDGPGPVPICYDTPGTYEVRYRVENAFGAGEVARHLRVERKLAAMEFSVGKISGAPGDLVEIPVLLRSVAGESLPGRSYQIRLRFNGSMLRPMDIAPQDIRCQGGECVVTLRGTESAVADTFARVRAMVALGDAEVTPITIDSVIWPEGCADEGRVQNGEFRPEICREGGARLITTAPPTALKTLRYDRGSARLEIHYTAPAGAPLEFMLADALGREVALVREYPVGDEGVLYLDASALAPGFYFCALRDETSSVQGIPFILRR